jgi:hypothetical protein
VGMGGLREARDGIGACADISATRESRTTIPNLSRCISDLLRFKVVEEIKWDEQVYHGWK